MGKRFPILTLKFVKNKKKRKTPICDNVDCITLTPLTLVKLLIFFYLNSTSKSNEKDDTKFIQRSKLLSHRYEKFLLIQNR